jgi:hypothetical protein
MPYVLTLKVPLSVVAIKGFLVMVSHVTILTNAKVILVVSMQHVKIYLALIFAHARVVGLEMEKLV